MIRAAGILFAAPDGKVLLMRRTGKDHAGSWAFPGGGIEGDETAEAAARREALEETGVNYEGPLVPWTRRIKDGIDFTTFLANVDPFDPTLNEEHDAFTWADRAAALGDVTQVRTTVPLHPGAEIGLLRFDLDELGIAKAIKAGELASPMRYVNVLLIALRITGTGASYRPSLNEFVWRDPSIYLTDEFLERCNGLPVIAEHPTGNMLNTKEFRDRIAGTILLPYIKDDEIWGVAKILDMDIAHILETERTSTSPAVVFVNDGPGSKYKLSDGRSLLIEEKPGLIDHLALLLGPGVWDKGGPLAGVDSVDAQDPTPSVELDAAKLDAIVRGVKLDEICSRLNRW